MSGKDEYIYTKFNLLKTSSGRKILKKAILKEKGYVQFKKYTNTTKTEYIGFVERFRSGMISLIQNDASPIDTHKHFIDEVNGSKDLELEIDKFVSIKNKLSDPSRLYECIERILNSNFVKMTFPVFCALFDGFAQTKHNNQSILSLRHNIIDGHILAIDLSEPMDRIIDKDEDIDYLEEYKFLNPYILLLAKKNISQCGKEVYNEFVYGFNQALEGQQLDYDMKNNLRLMTYETLEQSYKKYRSVLGTAGKNMSFNQTPLSEIYYIGMAKAAECVGCGNEIQDAIANKSIKIPSWPLYYSLITGDVKKGFTLTLEKSKSYLSEAYLALEMLDDEFEIKPFLDFLFLSVSHYNEFWFNDLFSNRLDLLNQFQKDLPKIN